MDLDLATTSELITELQKRMNFRGVLIWQPEYNGIPNTDWRWHSMHCLAPTVCSEVLQSFQIPVVVTEPADCCEPASSSEPSGDTI